MSEYTDYYPINIRESRYRGTYSGGGWVLTAGIYSPSEHAAFGGDIPCMEFWTEQEKTGPFFEHEERTVYVESGDDPGELYEEFVERVEQRDE